VIVLVLYWAGTVWLRMNKRRYLMDFITLDFEIANHKLSSACSLGMVFVEENVIVDKKSFLIKPPGLEVDPDYTKIHGITREMLKDTPGFPEIWSEIHHYFSMETLFVAHNAQFDMNVLKYTLLEYSIELPEFEYVCSIPASTRPAEENGSATP
jgi:DNA polymerase III subunit epsilon